MRWKNTSRNVLWTFAMRRGGRRSSHSVRHVHWGLGARWKGQLCHLDHQHGGQCAAPPGDPLPQETLIKLFWVHTLSQNKLSRYSICLISFVCMCSWLCLLQLQMSAIQNIKLAHLGSAPPCMEHYSLAWVLGEICSVLNISVVRKTSDGRSDPTESFIFSKKGLELVTATRWVVLLVLVDWSQLSQDVGAQDKRSQANPYAPPESPGSCLSSFTLCKGSRYSFSF